MLELKHIHKYYNPGTVNEMCLFQDFNLTIEDGEFVSVVGSKRFRQDVYAQYYLRKYSAEGDRFALVERIFPKKRNIRETVALVVYIRIRQ